MYTLTKLAAAVEYSLLFSVFVCLCGAERLALYAGRVGGIASHTVDFTSLPGPLGSAAGGPDARL